MTRLVRVVFLLIGVVLLVWLIARQGPGQILGMLRQVGWGFLPVAALYAAYQMLRAWALARCLPPGGSVPYRDTLRIRVAGEAVQYLTFTGPFLAEPSKAWLLGRRGITTTEGFAATIAEYLTYTCLSAVLMAIALAYLLQNMSLHGALRAAAITVLTTGVTFVAVAIVAVAGRIYLIGGVIAWLTRLGVLRGRARFEPGVVQRMEDLLLEVLRERRWRLATVALIELLAHTTLILELAWIAHLSGLAMPVGRALLIEGATKFTSIAFFFIPAQMGASEGVNVVVFELFALSGAGGVAVSLVRRVRSVAVAAAGLAAIAVLGERQRA